MGRVRAAARLGLLLALLGGLAGGLIAAHGDPVGEARVKWREFKSLQTTSTSATRYTSTGGQRYDLWRIALSELRSEPLHGVGEGSYQFAYYRLRRTNRNLEDPHGLLFQLGSELGLVGLALFAAILIGLVGSLRRWWRVAPVEARRSACALSAAGATFIGQSLVDWMWRIPGLTALGLLCLSVAAAILARSAAAPAGARTEPSPRRRPWGRVAASAGLLACIALVLSLYLSDVYTRHAREELGHSPSSQLALARTAAWLDPWSLDPHYLESSALESMDERSAAMAQLQDARRLEPTNEVPLALLGDFEARGGDYARARSYYRRALVLDPLDVGLQQLARSGGRAEGS
jgi:O-Antigen ligase